MFDPEITTVLPTYPIPDYPSGHATGLAATAQVLSYLFPRDEQFFQSRAEENAASRVWAGIHFRSASDAGVEAIRCARFGPLCHPPPGELKKLPPERR